MAKVYIDEVYPKSANANNYIVNFQNAYLTDEFKTKKCSLFEDRISGDKTIISDIADLLYVGTEEKSDLTKTVLLVRNKKSGKVKIVEVSTVDMKPVLYTNIDLNQTVDTSYLELSRKFGSKKQKKIVEQREKLKLNTETVLEQMHNVTANIAEDKLDLSSYTKTDSDEFYIPPINREAKKVEEVYDIYKILTEEQYEKIYLEMNSTDYVSDLLPWLKDTVMKQSKKEYKVLAVYANCLIKMNLTMIKDIVKKNFLACKFSATLNEVILNNFTVMSNNRRNRSLQLKDKSLCHAIVFLLLINNFKYDYGALIKEIRIAVKTLTSKVIVTGASIVTSGEQSFIQLKLPLKSRGGFGRRKSAKF